VHYLISQQTAGFGHTLLWVCANNWFCQWTI